MCNNATISRRAGNVRIAKIVLISRTEFSQVGVLFGEEKREEGRHEQKQALQCQGKLTQSN
jgi:hypothetical protein